MSSSRGQVWATAAYATMVLAAVALFLLIRSYGESLSPPAIPASSVAGPAAATSEILRHLLLALTAVIVAGRCLGSLFRLLGQPPVIGEVVAGILLGPSLLGRIAPDAYLFILPPEIAPFLGVLAQLGVIIYMFLVGLELNPDQLRGQVHATVATSHASIVLPFILGSALALYLYPILAPAGVPFTHFALFLGIAMSITAFPVLARILSDQGMATSRLGVLALTCAAVDDVTAWCLLAFVVGVVNATGGNALTGCDPDTGLHCGDVPGRASAVSAACGVTRRHASRRGVRSRSRSLPCWYRRSRPKSSAFTRSSARSCSVP